MERAPLAQILCALFFLAPILVISSPVSAELSGDIAFSTDGLSMSPSTAVEGGDVTFTLSLQKLNISTRSGMNCAVSRNKWLVGCDVLLQLNEGCQGSPGNIDDKLVH